MSQDKRITQSIKSLLSLQELLKEIKLNPQAFVNDQRIVDALSSQGALAKYSNTERNISGSSLNTAKRIAELGLDGGFAQLDELRRLCIEALDICRAKAPQTKPSSRASLSRRMKEVETENQKLREDLFLLTMALDKALKNALRYAKDSEKPAIMELSKREHRELLAMLSLRKKVDVGVIIGINDAV